MASNISDLAAYGPFGLVSPHAVRPTSLERVKKVREVIRRKYRLSLGPVNELTAALYGFPLYRQIADAHYASAPNLFEREDEFCSPEALEVRLAFQAKVLAGRVGIDLAEAVSVIAMVRPTSRDRVPTVRLSPFRRI